jgi:simple sugar transport system permease protein
MTIASGRIRKVAFAALPLVTGALLLIALLRFAGRDVGTTLLAILRSGFGDRLGITESLTRAIPLILTALAAAVPARAGLFNIGAEGQLVAGAAGATLVALFWSPSIHAFVLPLMLLVAMVFGALWALIPGMLRGFWNVNEVLVSLMLNYVAILLLEHLVHGPWKDSAALGWPYTAQFPAWAVLPRFGATNVHLGLLFGVIAALVLFAGDRLTRWGFGLRFIRTNARAAEYGGLRIGVYFALTMAVGGALAALAGAGEASVIQGRLRPGISAGYGYDGFLIAWLARNDFRLIVPVAVVVAALYSGADALQITSALPSSTVDIFIGLLFLSIFISRETFSATPAGATR